MEAEVMACPFCGVPPTVEKWHGSGRHSTLISCENDDCPAMPGVHGKSRKSAVEGWNTRGSSAGVNPSQE